MTEVKRSTEHRLEIENITIKIDSPEADRIWIFRISKPSVEGDKIEAMRIKIEDMSTLRIALQEFQNWLNAESEIKDTK
jgi:hypothetical protein